MCRVAGEPEVTSLGRRRLACTCTCSTTLPALVRQGVEGSHVLN